MGILGLDTSMSSYKGKIMILAPIIAGGVIGEYLDQKGYDEKILGFVPEQFKVLGKFTTVALLLIGTLLIFKADQFTSKKFAIGSLMAGAAIGILTNHAAKLVLSAKQTGGAV